MKVWRSKLKIRMALGTLVVWCAAYAADAKILQDPAPQDAAAKPTTDPTDKPAPPTKGSTKKQKDSATQSAEDQPKWDPVRAEKDLEVGQYYMRRGDVDAAIDRFEDAIEAKPGYAIPFRYLGEAQEKKGLKKQAVKSYKRYLELYPHAEDKEKIEKKIDKLYKEIEKRKAE